MKGKKKTKIPIWSNRVLSRDVLFGKEILVMPLQIRLKNESGNRRIINLNNLKNLTRSSSLNSLLIAHRYISEECRKKGLRAELLTYFVLIEGVAECLGVKRRLYHKMNRNLGYSKKEWKYPSLVYNIARALFCIFKEEHLRRISSRVPTEFNPTKRDD